MKLQARSALCLLLAACAGQRAGAGSRTSIAREPPSASTSPASASSRSRSEELADARALRDGQGRARDRRAALGHFLLAAAMVAPDRNASTETRKSDLALAETAAFEAAKLLKELRPDAGDDYRYLMAKAGLRGLVALADSEPGRPAARSLALEAVARYGYDLSESQRELVEHAALIAGDLVEQGIGGNKSHEAARFLYSKAGAAGAERMRSVPSTFKIVKGYGQPPSATATYGPRVFSLDTDANVVASQVFGSPMLGTLSALSDDSDNATDYLLIGKPAQWLLAPGTNEPNLYPQGGSEEERTYQAVVLAFHSTDESSMPNPDSIELLGAPSQLQLPVPACTWLVTPPYEYADDAEQAAAAAKKSDIEGSINELLDRAHRLGAWGGEGLIQLQIGFSIGYAGGGASYSGSWLLRASATGLKGAGCFMTQGHQLLAGNWRADGSRDHEENEEVWLMRPKPSASVSATPPLVFQPSGAAPKIHRVATYDPKLERYRIGRPLPGAAFKPTATPRVAYDWQ